MNSKITKTDTKLYLNLYKITLEQVETITNGLAVLTEQEAEKHGLRWNGENEKQRLLMSFIGLYDDMRGLEREQNTFTS